MSTAPSSNAKLDLRVNAYRPDLADIALANTVKAEKYVEPVIRQCVRGVLPLLAEPRFDAGQVSQIRYGEFLDVFETRDDGFAWVQNRTDRYVGYLPLEDTFSDHIADLSTRVVELRTFLYPEPNIKKPPLDELTLGSFIKVVGTVDKFVELESGGFVFAKHVAPVNKALARDYVFTAGSMLNVPYMWGGRTPRGIDCSGLVQLALDMAGIDVPRDSDQQREAIGEELPRHWRDMAWKRGDVVFFPGHVGFMTGPDQLLHASAFDMKVVVEPLVDVVLRGNEILAVGKPTP